MTEVTLTENSGSVRFEGSISPNLAATASPTFTGTVTCANLTAAGNVALGDAAADTIGFYGHAGIAQQTGVAVTAAAIHAALVATGLITA